MNFVNLIKFFKTKEKEEDYKGLAGIRLGTSQKFSSMGHVPLNSRPMRSANSDVYNKKNESKVRCILCQGWAYLRHQCKRCRKCGRYGHPSHLCWEKGRPEKRGVNAAELYEVDVGMLVPVEPVVDLTTHERNDESNVNAMRNKDPNRKRLLHVKSWMETSKIGVDLFVDTGSACNLMSTAICKRLGLVVTLTT